MSLSFIAPRTINNERPIAPDPIILALAAVEQSISNVGTNPPGSRPRSTRKQDR